MGQKRQPRGVPVGGQFARSERDEPRDLLGALKESIESARARRQETVEPQAPEEDVDRVVGTTLGGTEVTSSQVDRMLARVARDGGATGLLGDDDVVSAISWADGEPYLAEQYLIHESRARLASYRAKQAAMQAEDQLRTANQMALVATVNRVILQGKRGVSDLRLEFPKDGSDPVWRCRWDDGFEFEDYGYGTEVHESTAMIDPGRPADLAPFCVGYDPEVEDPGHCLDVDPQTGRVTLMIVNLQRALASRID